MNEELEMRTIEVFSVPGGLVAALLMCGGLCSTSASAQSAQPGVSSSTGPVYIGWSLPTTGKQYGAIDGKRLWQYVQEQADIARRYRDQGHPQFWGRIAGTSGDVEAVRDRDIRRGTNGKVVELHRIPNEHSDGMLGVYLPAEKVLWTADINVVNPNPGQLGVLRSAVQAFNRLNLDYVTWIQAHPPNPDRPLTKADVDAAAGL